MVFAGDNGAQISRAALAVAAISTAYGLAEAFVRSNKNENKKEEFNSLALSSPSSSEQSALPTVQEGDETGDTSPRAASKTENEKLPKQKKNSFIASLASVHDILKDSSDSAVLLLVGPAALAVVSRAIGELLMLRISCRMEASVSVRNFSNFEKLLTAFLVLGIPTTVLQHLAHWSAASLSSRLRKTLTDLLMSRLVLSPHNLCHPEELVDNERLDALMADIGTVSSLGVQLGADKLRKCIELILSLVILLRRVGVFAPLALIVYLGLSVSVLAQQKQFKSVLIKRVNEREQLLKKILARLLRHRDDIAVNGGASAEKEVVGRILQKVENAKLNKEAFEFLHGLSASLASRVGGAALGLALTAWACRNNADRSFFDYLLIGRAMLQLGGAFSSILEDELLIGVREETSRFASSARRLKASLVDLPKQLPPENLLPFRVRKSNVCLSDVTGVAPDGTVMFQSLSLELSPGGSLLVQGAKNSGKSALLRIIAGTWPAVMGEVSRPKEGVLCVPSKPYLLLEGSLKQQICYPDSDELIDQHRLDAAVEVSRIGHLFTVNGIARNTNGSAVMGEADQQKLMIARLVYHAPKYALLDDCWGKLEVSHFCAVLNYLKKELGCGIVLAGGASVVDPLKSPEFGFPFDVELILSARGKKPPRHEIVFHRS